MKIIEVNDRATRKKFFDIAREIYQNDHEWVCPLDSEIENKFDPAKNILLKTGPAARWILVDEKGTGIGRIAAFINSGYSHAQKQPTGGIGFFECTDHKEAAFMLFHTAENWLKKKGMHAMDGPVNFGENDSYWGLLVEGFTHPAYGMPYNKPYYQKFFEEYGFENYFEQYSYHKDLTSVQQFPERFMKIANWVYQKPGYTFKHFRFSQSDKFVADVVEIYNAAWSSFKENFSPMIHEDLKNSLKKAKPIIDEELIWFAYYQNKPIAFFIIFPDVNQIFKFFNGTMNAWDILRFVYYKYTRKITRMRALVAGVVPKFQNAGVESAIFKCLYQVFKKKPYYKELELSWVGDFNPKMRAIYEAVGAILSKTHITYRYLFDRDAKIVRYKEEMAKKYMTEEKVEK